MDLVNRVTAVPLAMINQLFTQAFWENGAVTKYGHEAIKISNQINIHSLKSVSDDNYFRLQQEYKEAFFTVQNMYVFAVRNHENLRRQRDLRWRVVADYLYSFTERFVESQMMLRRLRGERRTWQATDHELLELVAQMQRISEVAAPHLAGYGYTGAGQNLNAYLGHMDLLFDAAKKVQLRLEREGRNLQHLVVEFLKQGNEAREELATAHMGHLAVRIRDVLLQTLEQARLIASKHHQQALEVKLVSHPSRPVSEFLPLSRFVLCLIAGSTAFLAPKVWAANNRCSRCGDALCRDG